MADTSSAASHSQTGVTPYHAKYYAYELTKSGGEGIDRLTQSLLSASIDLTPHQIEAALFALRSPLSKGVLLADEVGLGKTIEAGLVLCQLWAERKRKLLVVCPAALRKQWQIELEEKFNLPSVILDAKAYRQLRKAGQAHPFDSDRIVIASYHYVSKLAAEVRTVGWQLVVIDEAHKLRNAYQPSNKIGQTIRWALENRRKILLTATPLQNSVAELYGLSTLIDDQIFGDLQTFKSLYAGIDGDLPDLRKRLQGFCHRTLRKDVLEFVRYTARRLITIPFSPTNDEQGLYEAVSRFLQREESYAFPKRQRQLMILIVRKLLASSPVALQGTLQAIRDRLLKLQGETGKDAKTPLDADLLDESVFEEYLDDMSLCAEEHGVAESLDLPDVGKETPSEGAGPQIIDNLKLQKELGEVEHFIDWSKNLGTDTKTRNLLVALNRGWEKMQELGAAEKAVIFTESRRSMEYLRGFLEANGYAGSVVCFSGGGKKDPEAEAIYKEYMAEYRYNDSVDTSGSKAIMLRHALIDRFRRKAKILIATEAGAEGINLQFCSLVINYDLPWNPQRIEQRIGRCHRYGQKHDVVVINFLNERNAADQRVYELLSEKFKLFDGIFGASDDVLGKIDNSTGLELKILQLYQQCRTEKEIQESFDRLQAELEEEIADKIQKVKQEVLENFDEDVLKLLKVDYGDALHLLGEVGLRFWALSRLVLGPYADFSDTELSFLLRKAPCAGVELGRYYLKPKTDVRQSPEKGDGDLPEGGILYRMNTGLGDWSLSRAKALEVPCREVCFSLDSYPSKITVLENLKGKSGCLLLSQLTLNSLDKEEYLLFTGFTDQNEDIPADVLEQLFKLSGTVGPVCEIAPAAAARLDSSRQLLEKSTLQKSMETNNRFFKERQEQLTRWVDDQIAVAERALKQAKLELRTANHEAELAANPTELSAALEKVDQLERKKRKARQHIDEVEEEYADKRKVILTALKRKIAQGHEIQNQPLFTIRWRVR